MRGRRGLSFQPRKIHHGIAHISSLDRLVRPMVRSFRSSRLSDGAPIGAVRDLCV